MASLWEQFREKFEQLVENTSSMVESWLDNLREEQHKLLQTFQNNKNAFRGYEQSKNTLPPKYSGKKPEITTPAYKTGNMNNQEFNRVAAQLEKAGVKTSSQPEANPTSPSPTPTTPTYDKQSSLER